MARVRQKNPNRVDTVFFSDQHFPNEHKPSIETTLSFTRSYQPDKIFVLGDVGDMEAPSSYVKHPRKALSTQECIEAMRSYFKRLRQAAPDAEIVYRLGNHEERWNNYLKTHPVITELEVLDYENLLHLRDFDIELVPYKATYIFNGLSIEHGDTARPRAGYTAAGMLDKRGISGISGHTHLLGIHYR
ncbi:MAG: hypothetical protein KDB07_06560, partial [Planctomycetes bacterium]|nr:hypothetical protein [Planctomycetota bacterium]